MSNDNDDSPPALRQRTNSFKSDNSSDTIKSEISNAVDINRKSRSISGNATVFLFGLIVLMILGAGILFWSGRARREVEFGWGETVVEIRESDLVSSGLKLRVGSGNKRKIAIRSEDVQYLFKFYNTKYAMERIQEFIFRKSTDDFKLSDDDVTWFTENKYDLTLENVAFHASTLLAWASSRDEILSTDKFSNDRFMSLCHAVETYDESPDLENLRNMLQNMTAMVELISILDIAKILHAKERPRARITKEVRSKSKNRPRAATTEDAQTKVQRVQSTQNLSGILARYDTSMVYIIERLRFLISHEKEATRRVKDVDDLLSRRELSLENIMKYAKALLAVTSTRLEHTMSVKSKSTISLWHADLYKAVFVFENRSHPDKASRSAKSKLLELERNAFLQMLRSMADTVHMFLQMYSNADLQTEIVKENVLQDDPEVSDGASPIPFDPHNRGSFADKFLEKIRTWMKKPKKFAETMSKNYGVMESTHGRQVLKNCESMSVWLHEAYIFKNVRHLKSAVKFLLTNNFEMNDEENEQQQREDLKRAMKELQNSYDNDSLTGAIIMDVLISINAFIDNVAFRLPKHQYIKHVFVLGKVEEYSEFIKQQDQYAHYRFYKEKSEDIAFFHLSNI